MALIRIQVHADEPVAAHAAALLDAYPYATNITRLRGASIRPAGDIVSCDVPREAASALLHDLDGIGATEGECCVTITGGSAHVGARARELEHQARGAASDALLWPVIEDTLEEEVDLSFTFLAFMVLAVLLAVIGLATDSAILVVGAMVIGPEFGPIANFCVSLIGGRWARCVRSWVTVAIGFGLAISLAVAFTIALHALGVFPDDVATRGLAHDVASPGWLSIIIALIAGAAGILSLTSARSATLVGVLISVTTVPAAGDTALQLAYGHREDALSSLGMLAINLTGIAVAGIVTLAVQRLVTPRLLAARD